LEIPSIIVAKSLQGIKINVTEKSTSWEANICSATHSIPCLVLNTYIHYYFHHSLSLAWLTPSHLISLVYPPSLLTHILQCTKSLWGTHKYSNLQMPWQCNKLSNKKYQKMMNDRNRNWQTTVKLAQTKPKESQATNNTNPNLTIIYYSETTEERKRLTMTNTTPNLSCLY
jgi:hypothetical protein